MVRKKQPGVETSPQARWIKKAGKLHYGYKKHFLTDDNGLVLTVRTTAANQHDSKSLEPLIKNSDLSPAPGSRLYAGKAYKSKADDELLKQEK